jgi:tryptophan synthase alpha chain
LSRIEQTFDRLQQENKKALVAFLTAGDPDMESTEALFSTIEQNGADIIELGVPFSDPLADGPVIQVSSQRSLKAGTTLRKILGLVGKLRESSQLPIVLMTSYNPVFVYGQEKFVDDALAAGVDGVIIPDLPPDEAGEFETYSHGKGLDVIYLLAPTSTPKRIEWIGGKSRGFIYYVSLTGTTGMRDSLAEGVIEKVEFIKSKTSLPVLIGFGISNPDNARHAVSVADGVIVGSAIVRIIDDIDDAGVRLQKVGELVHSLKQAIEPGA